MSLSQAKPAGILTAEQFEVAVSVFPRLSETGKAAAKLVLVDGQAQVEVAAHFGIRRQQVNKWVKDIYQAHQNIPDGWLVDTVTLPPDLMGKVKDIEQKARREHTKKFPSETGR